MHLQSTGMRTDVVFTLKCLKGVKSDSCYLSSQIDGAVEPLSRFAEQRFIFVPHLTIRLISFPLFIPLCRLASRCFHVICSQSHSRIILLPSFSIKPPSFFFLFTSCIPALSFLSASVFPRHSASVHPILRHVELLKVILVLETGGRGEGVMQLYAAASPNIRGRMDRWTIRVGT